LLLGNGFVQFFNNEPQLLLGMLFQMSFKIGDFYERAPFSG
jgi:hypothetical protein